MRLATSTLTARRRLLGDIAETMAVKTVMGGDANKVAVSSTKSMIGHALGAAGSVEAVICVLALRDQVAPPTINLDNPDEGCDLDYVPHHAKEITHEGMLCRIHLDLAVPTGP